MFAYVYFMNQGQVELDRDVVPEHIRYWQTRSAPDYRGGPFADRSGGLIIFRASSGDAALETVVNDPFQLEGVLGDWWLKEWEPETPGGVPAFWIPKATRPRPIVLAPR